MPLFGKSSKSPTEVVKVLKEGLTTLEKVTSIFGLFQVKTKLIAGRPWVISSL